MQILLEELVAGNLFCDQAGFRQFACFGPDKPGPSHMSSLLFLSWTGLREPLWYTSYGDEDYDSHSQ